MILVSFVLLYLAIVKKFEPLLLVPDVYKRQQLRGMTRTAAASHAGSRYAEIVAIKAEMVEYLAQAQKAMRKP